MTKIKQDDDDEGAEKQIENRGSERLAGCARKFKGTHKYPPLRLVDLGTFQQIFASSIQQGLEEGAWSIKSQQQPIASTRILLGPCSKVEEDSSLEI